MKFSGPITQIKQFNTTVEVLLILLVTAFCAGAQKHSSILTNVNITLIDSPPSQVSDPMLMPPGMFEHGFVEVTTEAESTTSIGTTYYPNSYLLPISFLAFALFLC